MRVTGGQFGGRRLGVPRGGRLRPTQDRVRGALFSMLAEIVPGARVLDLFAGTGAVGFDALSRGAAATVWVEADRRHSLALKANLAALGAAGGTVVCCEALRWLQTAAVESFDLVFADPPYDWAREHGFAGLADVLRARGWVRPAGWFVVEQGADLAAPALDGWKLVRDRAYGQTRLAVNRLEASDR